MRLSTIWSIPAMTLAERLQRTRDWAFSEVAARLPVRLRYFVAVQQMAKVSQRLPNVAVPEITFEQFMKNIDTPKRLS